MTPDLEGSSVSGAMLAALTVLALAAGPDSLPPPQVVRDTVYIERTVNPQAAPVVAPKEPSKLRDVVGFAAIAGGILLYFTSLDDRDQEIVIRADGSVRTKRTGFSEGMVLGAGLAAFGIVVVAF